MSMLPDTGRALGNVRLARCYGCFRRQDACFCATIPLIDNQTEVLILQHLRERFHPFNTARIVRKSLIRSSLLVTHPGDSAVGASLKPRAGLLYPGPGATLLSDLTAEQLPEQLVILDGTWHHAKTLVRDTPALARLPQYRLAPAAPSAYRIRREPTVTALSTVEATIAALRVLEPETRGFDRLMDAFLGMIDHQLAHPKLPTGRRSYHQRRRTSKNVPSVLLGDLGHVVACYGESTPSTPETEEAPSRPIYWVAERLGTGERFACLIRPDIPLQEAVLGHLEMTREDFAGAVSLEDAAEYWAAFLHPEDTLAVYNQGVARLLAQLSAAPVSCLVLKSVNLGASRCYRTLDEVLRGEGIAPAPAGQPGRAGKRLANLTGFARYLHGLGPS